LQKRANALRPSRFIVLGAFNALVVQVALELPAFFEEDSAEALDFEDDARAFSRTNIEPDARAEFNGGRAGESMNDVQVPPDGEKIVNYKVHYSW